MPPTPIRHATESPTTPRPSHQGRVHARGEVPGTPARSEEPHGGVSQPGGRTPRALPTVLAVLLLAAGLALAPPARAEAPDAAAGTPDPALEAMAPLAAMAGRWEGTGWMRQGPGDPVTFLSSEVVESRLDGRALLIEGLHHAAPAGEGSGADGAAAERGPVVHHALALLTWNEPAGEYDFRSYVTGRGPGDFTGYLRDDGAFVWGGDTPRGAMRYVIRIDGDTWNEVGEFSRDGGETWMPFFGMDLERVGD